jgi:hypothetical protein
MVEGSGVFGAGRIGSADSSREKPRAVFTVSNIIMFSPFRLVVCVEMFRATFAARCHFASACDLRVLRIALSVGVKGNPRRNSTDSSLSLPHRG